MIIESEIKFESRIRKYQKAQMKKGANRTVSALPLMARIVKILSPLIGYQMRTSSAILQQEVTVQLS